MALPKLGPAELLLGERDWLIKLLTDPGRVDITDTGFGQGEADIVYEVPYGRFEITMRLLESR